MSEKTLAAVKKAREGSKRNFKQSFDLSINLKNVDLKRPENKVKTEVTLPHPISKPAKVGIFADALIPRAAGVADLILIRKDQIDSYARNKKAAKALANSCTGFVAEAPLMPQVAKVLGPFLAVRNKMPKPIPPTVADLKPLVERTKNSVRLALKDSPVVNCRIGIEEMKDEQVAENIDAAIGAVAAALPKGKEQIKNAYVKLTMSKPAKIEM